MITLRYLVSVPAEQRGMTATFIHQYLRAAFAVQAVRSVPDRRR